MCGNCGAELGPDRQIEFLKRYLLDQERRLGQAGENTSELQAEIEKTKSLLDQLEQSSGCGCA